MSSSSDDETACAEEKERCGDRASPPFSKHFARVFREKYVGEKDDQGNATEDGGCQAGVCYSKAKNSP